MEHRKTQRFGLCLPIEVVRRDSHSEVGETRNLSSGGVLFKLGTKLRIGERFEYVVTLLTPEGAEQSIRIHCKGRVMRITENGEIAATMERWEFVRVNRADSISFSYPSLEPDLMKDAPTHVN